MVVDTAVARRAQSHEVVLVVTTAVGPAHAVMDENGPCLTAPLAHVV